MKNIVFIVGSVRKNSFNGRLAKVAEEALRNRVSIAYLHPQDVPLLDQDIEFPPPESVRLTREKVIAADAVWIFTPEYNHNIPGGLKNLLDWLSRPLDAADPARTSALTGKKVAFAGIGGGGKTADARRHLAGMCAFLRMDLIGSDGVGFALPASAWSTGRWDPEPQIVSAIESQADQLLAALG